MNQILRPKPDFSDSRSVPMPPRLVPLVLPRPARRQEPCLPWKGWLAWIAEGWRRFRGYRNTLAALDRLSPQQLQDIGFRRLPGERSDYERLP